ncbi:hypothetical protein BN1200_1790112 [Klebsiella variicola]|nr:hypothetical protein BN1200_1790112 [Klebsiella variicola]
MVARSPNLVSNLPARSIDAVNCLSSSDRINSTFCDIPLSSSAKNLHQLLFGVGVCLIHMRTVDFISNDWPSNPELQTLHERLNAIAIRLGDAGDLQIADILFRSQTIDIAAEHPEHGQRDTQ